MLSASFVEGSEVEPRSEFDGNIGAIWPNNVRQLDITDSRKLTNRVNATPWILPAPTATWEYPKKLGPADEVPHNPLIFGPIPLLPQGFTFTLAGSQNGEAGFKDGVGLDARYASQ